ERGRGELQPELDGARVEGVHGRHHRLERRAALGAFEVRVQHAVEARLHVGRAEGLAVVPLDAATEVEGVRAAVRRGRPPLREVARDLRRVVRIVVEQSAVDAGGRLLDDERRLGVDVEAPGVAVVEPGEDATVAGLLLRAGAYRVHGEGEGDRENVTNAAKRSHRLSLGDGVVGRIIRAHRGAAGR